MAIQQNGDPHLKRLVSRVKFYVEERGYGFLLPPDGEGEDVFFHVSALSAAVQMLERGQVVSYTPGRDRSGRLIARDIRPEPE